MPRLIVRGVYREMIAASKRRKQKTREEGSNEVDHVMQDGELESRDAE